jgi:hypothetical protein
MREIPRARGAEISNDQFFAQHVDRLLFAETDPLRTLNTVVENLGLIG